MPTRRIRLYAMHGHEDRDALDYEAFFSWFRGLSRAHTQTRVWPDLSFVLESVADTRGGQVFRILSGDPDQAPLLVDEATGQITEQDVSAWSASRTLLVVDVARRLIAIEMRRAGVTDRNLERYFSILARDRGFSSRLDLQFSLFAGPRFEEELKRFERIKEASVVVAEPNIEWLDSPDELSRLAKSSGGRRAELSVTAPRNESLEKSTGIMGLILDQAKKALPSLARATVTGRKYGEDADTTVSSASHPLQRIVATKKGMTPSDLEARLVDAAADLIAEAPDGPEASEASGTKG